MNCRLCDWCGGDMKPLEPAVLGTVALLSRWVWVCGCGHEMELTPPEEKDDGTEVES